MKTFIVDNLEVTYPIEAKEYNEIKIPKGWRIPKIYELMKIYIESDVLKEYETGDFIIFWTCDEYNYGVRRLYRNYVVGGWGCPRGRFSSSCGRVVFVKEEK